MARVTRDPRRSRNACLYCRYGTHSLADVVLRRRAAPSPVGSPRSVPSRRGRPRRSHRRGRLAPALRPRSLALDVRVLHRGPPPLRGRGLPPDRRRPRLARASPPPDHAGRRAAAPDGHREAGAAPDPGEPGGSPEAGRPPVEARDRGARGGAFAPSGCSGGDAEAARPTGGTTSPALRLGPDAEAPSLGLRPEGGASVDRQLRPDGVARGRASNGCPPRSGSAARLLPGPARGGRAPRPGPLQGPVHRLRRASRQARATAGPHALLGARRRPRRDRRASRHREAPEARSPAFRPDPGAEEDALAERDLPHDAPDPGRGEASRVRAGRRPMPLRGRTGETMHGAPRARVPPPAPVRPRR